MKFFLFAFFLTFLLFLSLVSATPILFDPTPKNGTYITGGAEYLFSIHILEENLNVSSVYLHVGSQEVWPDGRSILLMDCFQYPTYWVCNKTVLIAVAESGTKEFYFFEASDLNGNYNSSGNLTYPLEVIIDRTAPLITPYNFKNMSYIGINKPIKVKVEDTYSGVNVSSVISLVYWLYGNETWNSTWEPMIYENETQTFKADWNTSILPNNSTWAIYVNASDNVGNWNSSKIAIVLIDNEYPYFEIISPLAEQKVWGSLELEVYAKDAYSGIAYVNFEVSSALFSGSLSCQDSLNEYNCSGLFDTTQVSDGLHLIKFIVSDNANNVKNESVNIEVNNTYPIVYLIAPQNNSYVSGLVLINTSVKNVREIREAWVQFETFEFLSEWKTLHCQNFYCFYEWDTSVEKETDYIIRVRIVNEVGYQTLISLKVKVDNTKPIITLVSPEGKVSENISLQLVATDENGLNVSARFNISQFTEQMQCNVFVGGKKIVCAATFDSRKIPNGEYTIYFFVNDLAGNEANASQKIEVENLVYAPELPTEMPNVTENVTNITGEGLGIVFPPLIYPLLSLLPFILLLAPLPFAFIYLSKRKKEVKLSKIEEELEEERSGLEMIRNYLTSASQSKDKIILKEFLLNVEYFIGSLKEESLVKNEFEKSLKIFPSEIRERILEKYKEKLERIGRKKELVKEIKKLISEALETDDLNKMRENSVKAKANCEILAMILNTEIELWERFSKEFTSLISKIK
jgi:hypothetical protein